MRHAPVERRDELEKRAGELSAFYLHGLAPRRAVWRRDTFQTSPHLTQRQ
jgi:hypothetical protein